MKEDTIKLLDKYSDTSGIVMQSYGTALWTPMNDFYKLVELSKLGYETDRYTSPGEWLFRAKLEPLKSDEFIVYLKGLIAGIEFKRLHPDTPKGY